MEPVDSTQRQATGRLSCQPHRHETLGMFYDVVPRQDHEVIFGADVATQRFIEAVLRYGSMDRYELFSRVEESTRSTVVQDIQNRQGAAKDVQVHGYRTLLDCPDRNFTAWHDANSQFGRAFYYRSAYARKLFPITFAQHTISYQPMLHEWFLPLLLADSHSCDSIICSSSSSRTALSNLLDYVVSTFNQAFGTQLRYRGRIDVIPFGVDTDLFQPRDKGMARRQLGFPENAFIILCLGRFSPVDKMDLIPLLKVFSRLLQ